MESLNFILENYATMFAVIVRSIAFFDLLIFCLPLQIREVQVGNGLRGLRIQLLLMGLCFKLINIISIIGEVTILLAHHPEPLVNAFLQVINALGMIAITILLHSMYVVRYKESYKEDKDK